MTHLKIQSAKTLFPNEATFWDSMWVWIWSHTLQPTAMKPVWKACPSYGSLYFIYKMQLSQHRRRHSKNPGVCLGYCNTVIPADPKLRTFLVSWPSYCLWSNITIWKHSHTHSLVWSSQHSSEVGRASNINFITQREKLKFTKMKYLATGHLTAGIASRAFSCFPLTIMPVPA